VQFVFSTSQLEPYSTEENDFDLGKGWPSQYKGSDQVEGSPFVHKESDQGEDVNLIPKLWTNCRLVILCKLVFLYRKIF